MGKPLQKGDEGKEIAKVAAEEAVTKDTGGKPPQKPK